MRSYINKIKILCLVLLFSCDTDDDRIVFKNVRREVWTDGYVDQFFHEAVRYGIVIKNGHIAYDLIKVGERVGPRAVIGACWRLDKVPQKIIIDRNFIAQNNKKMIEALIFHELGHCILQQEHRDNISLMNPSIRYDYAEIRDYLIAEFFMFTRNQILNKTKE